MGNVQTLPKCPSPFESVGNLSCVMNCPNEKGYERRNVNGGLQCVYRADPRYSTTLNTVSAVIFNGSTLSDLQSSNSVAYGEFVRERDRFTNEIVILDGKINKDVKLRDAFQRLQDAENVRDKAPDAYQQARSNYYTLKEGEKWIESEKERLLKAEVEPTVKKLVEDKNAIIRQYETQRKTVDVVNGLKDKVLSLKDEVKYAADTFKDQLNKVQDAINRGRRERDALPETSIWTWLDTILNIFIIAALLYVIYLVYQRFMRPRPAVSMYSSSLGQK